jgi:hypothetical protein
LKPEAARARSVEITALSAYAIGLGSALLIDDPRARFPLFVLAMLLAGAGWVVLVERARRGAIDRRILAAGLAIAIAASLTALVLAPAFSDDVFRYVYEGRVVWRMGPAFPFAHPPADAASLGVPSELLDASWRRINHPEIATIYPPFAQLVFATAGGLGDLLGGAHLLLLKLLLALFGFGAAMLAAKGAKLEGASIALCPLLVVEVAREGHADSLAAFALALGAYGFAANRPRLGYSGFAIAVLAKLNGLAVLPAAIRATRRGLLLGCAIAALVLLPVLFVGPDALAGVLAYATAWRSGDGAFTLLLALAEAILGGDWTRIGTFTITRHQLARAFALALFASSAALVLRTRSEVGGVPRRAALLLILLLLLSPTLHPWYAIWLLPFVLFSGPSRRAAIALLVSAPILHHAAWLEQSSGEWTDLLGVRALVHAPVWALLLGDLFRDRRSR